VDQGAEGEDYTLTACVFSNFNRSFDPKAKPAVFTNYKLQDLFYLLPYYLPTSHQT
jgi:hypothetical protein